MTNKTCIAIFSSDSLDNAFLDYYIRLSKLIGDELILVSPDNIAKPEKYKKRLTFYSDEEILENIDLRRSTHVFPRAKWYIQQLIKLSAADVLFHEYSTVIIVDGDTLISQKVLNLPRPVVNKIENKAYLRMFKLLGFEEIWMTSAQELLNIGATPIVNFGIWELEDFQLCLSSSAVRFKEWINVIADYNHHNISQASLPIFSEYLLLFVAKMLRSRTTNIKQSLTPIRSFRRADLLWTTKKEVISCMSSNKFDMVAFEKNHSSTLIKKLMAQVFWKLSIDIK